jgi:hypothetical protein
MIERAFTLWAQQLPPDIEHDRRALYRQAFHAGWRAHADAVAFKMWLAMRASDDME